MLSQIYKLFNYYITTNIPEIKNIDLLTKTTFDEKTNKRYAYPAIFLDIRPIEITTYLGKADIATVYVNLHLVQNNISTVTNTDKRLESILTELTLVDKLYSELDNIGSHGLPEDLIEPDYIIYKLKRIGITINNELESNTLRDIVVTFKFEMLDASKMSEKEYIRFSSLDDISLDVKY